MGASICPHLKLKQAFSPQQFLHFRINSHETRCPLRVHRVHHILNTVFALLCARCLNDYIHGKKEKRYRRGNCIDGSSHKLQNLKKVNFTFIKANRRTFSARSSSFSYLRDCYYPLADIRQRVI